MKKWVWLSVLILTTAIISTVFLFLSGRKHTIQSQILEEKRPLLVHLPPGYSGTVPTVGYFVQRPTTNTLLFFFRAFVKDGDIKGAVDHVTAGTNLHPLNATTESGEPPKVDFINTSGLGRVTARKPIGPAGIVGGDAVIVSGDIGRHGMAVMTAREGFAFETDIASDCAPLAEPVLALLEAGIDVHCLRDLTRGGLASALVEIAETARRAIRIEEGAVPVDPSVASACELLGIDPLHVACEGRFAAFVAREHVEAALDVLKRFETTAGATVIGEVDDGPPGRVTCRGLLGVARIIDMLSGEQLPRIC